MVWILSAVHTVSVVRAVWKTKEAKHLVLRYFDMAEKLVYAVFPFVFYKAVHLKLDKMKHLLEIVSHNSLLKPDQENFRKIVRYVFKYLFYKLKIVEYLQ